MYFFSWTFGILLDLSTAKSLPEQSHNHNHAGKEKDKHIPSDGSLGQRVGHSTADAAHTAAEEEEHSLHQVEGNCKAKMQEEGRTAVAVEGRQGSLGCSVVVGKGWSSSPEEGEGCHLGERIRTEGFLEVAHSIVVVVAAGIAVLDTSCFVLLLVFLYGRE